MRAAGFPLGGVTVQIRSENGEELPAGEIGEIILAGDNMMTGYLPDAANRDSGIYTDENGRRWIRTGISGRLDDGYLTLENM